MSSLKNGAALQKGKYTITNKLGQGSFGITYLATMRTTIGGRLGKMDTNVNVTVKEFFMSALNSRSADGTSVERTDSSLVSDYKRKFIREAENLSHLHHDNIVKVLDVFEENNTAYYVMEYLDGGNLDDLIRKNGKLTAEQTMDVTRDVCAALQYMHESRMLHLDLKPKNIMLTSEGKVKLIDFGLSKQYNEEGEPESSTTLGLGTPGYAPLEQATYKQDGSLPVTLDIYALGASMYKMLTGKVPPVATDIFNDGLPLQPLHDAKVPETLMEIITKAMSLRKLDRYQSVAEIAALLGNPTIEEETHFDHPVPPVISAEETMIDDNKNETASDGEQQKTIVDEKTKQQKTMDDEKTKLIGDSEDTTEQKDSPESPTIDKPKNKKKKRIIIAAVCGLLLLAGIIGTVVILENGEKWHPITYINNYKTVMGEVYPHQFYEMCVPDLSISYTKGLKKAAENGDAEAQFELGYWYYSYGNEGQAVTWYMKAADQGNENAINCLGVCYLFGDGVNKDFEIAVNLFREAAEKGDEGAQVNLGSCYEYGIGVPKDNHEAIKWYEKAASQGNRYAKDIIDKFVVPKEAIDVSEYNK